MTRMKVYIRVIRVIRGPYSYRPRFLAFSTSEMNSFR